MEKSLLTSSSTGHLIIAAKEPAAIIRCLCARRYTLLEIAMIGIIVRVDKTVEELDQDWIPSAFSTSELSEAFDRVLGYAPSSAEFCHEEGNTLIYFTIDDLEQPRAVTFNCTMAGDQAEIIKNITSILGAKIYDSEAGSFVEASSVNKAKQHQSLRSLDSLVVALFVHGFAILAQKSQQQACRCWRR